jgi:hypothetical protein
MSFYYDITTADGYIALKDICLRVDIHLGYIAADGVTATPQPGVSAWQVAGVGTPVSLPLGETTTWTQIRVHPVTVGRYALLVDMYVVLIVAAEKARLNAIGSPTAPQTALLNALNSLTAVALDSSWTPSP